MTETTSRQATQVVAARGRISAAALLSGAAVALVGGAVVAALVAAGLGYLGFSVRDLSQGAMQRDRIIAGAVVVMVPFLACLWGGYTAGRMGRGAGFGHGLLLAAVILAIGAVAMYGYGSVVQVPGRLDRIFEDSRFPAYVALAGAVATLIGSVLGGVLGARWHRRLEWKAHRAPAGEFQEETARSATAS